MLATSIGCVLLSRSMTEVWFRNPLTYVRECAELLVTNIAWDRGLLTKNRVDPQRHAEIHLPSMVQYRLLLVGDQGTAELRRGFPITKPYAVYPTWEYGVQDIAQLESMLRTPMLPDGQKPDEIGVAGQEHRVVIIRPPNAHELIGRAFIKTLKELQFEYPKAIIHYHGTYSFAVAFGHGFGAADIDPVSFSAKGKVILGSGRYMPWEEASEYPAWVSLSGYSHADLKVARNRTMFNMRSAMWAADNFTAEDRWRVRPGKDDVVDVEAPVPEKQVVKRIHESRLKPQPGDKIACDRCSLAPTCRYQRQGGVCIVPDSETSGLARYFKTRDSGQIIDGLSRVMEAQIRRAERGMATEANEPELDPEVTKILKHVFDSGVKLAKLVNPDLAGGTKVGIFVGGDGKAAVGAGTENALVAAVVAELEASGIQRADIDAEMVAQYLANKNRAAIEVQARE